MIVIVAISHTTALEAQRQILGCEACSEDAEIPLCWVLDSVTGRDGAEDGLRALRGADVPQVRGRGYGRDLGGVGVGRYQEGHSRNDLVPE